jgi:hypothetical protein
VETDINEHAELIFSVLRTCLQNDTPSDDNAIRTIYTRLAHSSWQLLIQPTS